MKIFDFHLLIEAVSQVLLAESTKCSPGQNSKSKECVSAGIETDNGRKPPHSVSKSKERGRMKGMEIEQWQSTENWEEPLLREKHY